MCSFPLAIVIAWAGCGSSGDANGAGGSAGFDTLDDEAAVQRLFDMVGADVAELLAEGVRASQQGQALVQKAYPNCTQGGTLSVDPGQTQATFSRCMISGISIDGSTSSFAFTQDFSTDQPPVLLSTTVTLSGTFNISGLLTGTATVSGATFVWSDSRACWSATGQVTGGASFDVQSLDQTCGQPVACGDSIVGATEECDDGNTMDGDGCSGTCAFEVLTCGSGVPQCLIGDDFAGSALGGWTETFNLANGWTYEVTGGELVVTDVDSALACNRYGEQWSHARIQQSFEAVDDYRLEVSASWDSGSSSAVQEIRIRLIGTSVNCAVVYQLHTHDLFVPFCAATGGHYRQLEGIAGSGAGTFRFESCGGDLHVFFNGNLMLSMPSEPVSGVQLSFGYYKVNDLGTDTTVPCSAGTTVSTFGEIRVGDVILESPPPGSAPGVVCGI
jgi:cysteine-rich repeat protein